MVPYTAPIMAIENIIFNLVEEPCVFVNISFNFSSGSSSCDYCNQAWRGLRLIYPLCFSCITFGTMTL